MSSPCHVSSNANPTNPQTPRNAYDQFHPLPPSLIPTQLIRKPLPRRHKLAQLPSHHILRNLHLNIALPIVNRKAESDEIRQHSRGAGLRLYWRKTAAGCCGGGDVGGAGDGQAADAVLVVMVVVMGVWMWAW